MYLNLVCQPALLSQNYHGDLTNRKELRLDLFLTIIILRSRTDFILQRQRYGFKPIIGIHNSFADQLGRNPECLIMLMSGKH
jgi:hypothetical protein